tara:strand:- start:10917 stop:11336 length:420 start_codon:yes stop_codon:yes gene_type:complete
MYRLSKRSLNRLEGVNPLLIAIIVEGIKNSPYDFGIPNHGGKRTAEEQNKLYKDKKSQRDGYNKKSYHQSGKAFDIFLYIDGKASWDKDKLEEVSKHLKTIATAYNVRLTWGGDWNNNGIRVDKDSQEHFFDGAHFQIS